MAVLLVRDDREYLLERGETLETDLGILEVPEDATAGEVVTTHLDEAFTVRELRGPDCFNHFERTGAPMMPRDVGLIVGHTGVSAGDTVLDAGTGTGVLAAYMGRAGADVITFERDPEFAEVARENMALAGVADRVDVRTGDVTEELDVGPVDVVTLDTEDAATVAEHAVDLLTPGGYLAAYSPFVEQAREVARTAADAGLAGIETLETIQREMDFDDRGSRPSTAGVGHTGFLTFARRE